MAINKTATLQRLNKIETILQRCNEANIASNRTIHLTDIIHVLQEHYQDYIPDNTISILCQCFWDLHNDDLAEQPEENVDYIFNILQNNRKDPIPSMHELLRAKGY